MDYTCDVSDVDMNAIGNAVQHEQDEEAAMIAVGQQYDDPSEEHNDATPVQLGGGTAQGMPLVPVRFLTLFLVTHCLLIL